MCILSQALPPLEASGAARAKDGPSQRHLRSSFTLCRASTAEKLPVGMHRGSFDSIFTLARGLQKPSRKISHRIAGSQRRPLHSAGFRLPESQANGAALPGPVPSAEHERVHTLADQMRCLDACMVSIHKPFGGKGPTGTADGRAPHIFAQDTPEIMPIPIRPARCVAVWAWHTGCCTACRPPRWRGLRLTLGGSIEANRFHEENTVQKPAPFPGVLLGTLPSLASPSHTLAPELLTARIY